MFFKNKQFKGFTLVEMLAVMTIVGIIMAISFVILERTIPVQRASRVTLKVAGEIERVRTMSILNQFAPGKRSPPKGGFGIYFDRTRPQVIQYILFADVNGNGLRNSPEEDIGRMRSIEGVKIAEVRVDGLSIGGNMPILFRPFWGNNNREIIITLRTEDGIERQIRINRAGMIGFGH